MNDNYTESWGNNGQQGGGQPAQPAQTGPVRPYAPIPPGYSQKSRVAAGVLGLLLGAFGIHNFYLGNTKRGLIQLLVSVCTCGIGAIGIQVWALIESIQILTGNIQVDGKGVPLA